MNWPIQNIIQLIVTMATSVFIPCDIRLYQVIDEYNSIRPLSSVSESMKSFDIKETKKMNGITKKRWNTQSKQHAIIIGKEMGLSKAVRFLRKTLEYKDLCPSTLYYWLQSENKKTVISSSI